jgi:phosphoglycolate phosphatase-like HAD superfamily hydrolase
MPDPADHAVATDTAVPTDAAHGADTAPGTDGRLLVRLEGTLWLPGRLWELAVEHVATRFARVRPLDVAALPAAVDPAGLSAAMSALHEWAAGDEAWQRELVRYFDEHLSMHVRPDPSLSRAVRALGRSTDLVAVSALPEPAARAVLEHAGLARAFADVRGGVSVDDADVTAGTPVRDAGHLRDLAEALTP